MKASGGFELFSSFMKNEYIPAARKQESISLCTNGKEYYEMLVKYYTTLPMTVEEVHQKGVAEVARIRKEMELVKNQTGLQSEI